MSYLSKDQDQLVKEYLKEVDWLIVIDIWTCELDKFGINFHRLFVDIEIQRESPIDRNPEIYWWPKSKLAQMKRKLLEHLKSWPNTAGPVHFFELSSCQITTLHLLWEARSDLDKICGVLIAASLFGRLHSSRNSMHYPKNYWPPRPVLDEIDSWVRMRWQPKNVGLPWYHSCNSALPHSNRDTDYVIRDLRGMIRYLAEEHARVLSIFQPVRLSFVRK